MKTIAIWHETRAWTDWYVDALQTDFPGHDFRAAYSAQDALAMGGETQAFIGIGPKMTPELVAAMPRLEWVQSLTTGVDNLLGMEAFPPHVPISKVTGVQGPQMAELGLTLMFALSRDVPGMLDAQATRTWDRRPQALLYGKTICLLGLGSIAETLALYCRTLGMHVTGISGRAEAPNVDRIYPRTGLQEAVAEADFLVVLVPLSPETTHIVGPELLAAMKPSAFLINLARGGCVDEAALQAALTDGQIAGAGLDVFQTEPLPKDHPLWSAPNVILTPHVGGFSDIYHKQCYPTVQRNMALYLEHGPEALVGAVRRA